MATPKRSHPIRQLLDKVGLGHEPSAAELDALALPADVRKDLEATIDDIHAARSKGNRSEARRIVREESGELIDATPDTAGGWEPPEKDPAKLAENVPRW